MTLAPLVWDAPPLRGLDARARADLALVAARRELAGGVSIFRPGDRAEHLFVVESGAVLLDEGRGTRRVTPGEAFGEESLVFTFGSRARSAHADGPTVIVALPSPLLRRVWQRAGAAGHAAKVTRTATRQALRDVLARHVDAAALEATLDAARVLEVARGDVVARHGEEALFVVVTGLVRLEDDGEVVVGHLGPGGVVDGAAAARVVAARPSALVRIAAPHPPALATAAREARTRAAEQRADGETADLGRLVEARSLALLDGDLCIRCGHCVAACADAHTDGAARLSRSGPIGTLPLASGAAPRASVVATSCAHCRTPACLPACPTGAIVIDEAHRVVVREELCTGCGSCVKACPWEALALSARPDGAGAEPGTSADVALKCDLCSGPKVKVSTAGPACVAACPTGALVRVDAPIPSLTVEATAGPAAAGRSPTQAAVASGAGLVLVLMGTARPARLPLGVAALALMVALAAYALHKRAARTRRAALARLLAPLGAAAKEAYGRHAMLGLAAFGAVLGHAQGSSRGTGLARAALAAFLVASASGAFASLVYRTLPRRVTLLSAVETLPGDGPARARLLSERTFAALTGRNDLVKAVYARVLAPYRSSPLVLAQLLATPTPLGEQRRRLESRIDAALEGRGKDKREGLAPLVDAVVTEASFRAVRVAQATLAVFGPVHAIAATVALVVTLAHALVEIVNR